MLVAPPKLVIAISSRALFDLSDSHQVFEADGVEAYSQYQIEHEGDTLPPGVAFPLIDKLGKINAKLAGKSEIQIILLSRNSADTGLRVFNSISHYGLDIKGAAFTGGNDPYQYIHALGANLFLSANSEDVREALNAGFAAATMLPSADIRESDNDPTLRIAFDGDAVIFSDESELIYQSQGLSSFEAHEQREAATPLPGGPFRTVLETLHHIQQIPEASELVRTALITARGVPTQERVIRTLRAWGVRIDEAFFMGGRDKGAVLNAYKADIFFDDQQKHCDSARQHVPTGHVPNSI